MIDDAAGLRLILSRLESKLETIQEEMKLQKETLLKAIDLLGNDVNGTKKNSVLILKSLGLSNTAETKRPKQSTLQNWFKKPARSPEKLDLSKLSAFTNGGIRRGQSPGKQRQQTSSPEFGLPVEMESHRFSTSESIPLGYGLGITPPLQVSTATTTIDNATKLEKTSENHHSGSQTKTSPTMSDFPPNSASDLMSPVLGRQRPPPPAATTEFLFKPPKPRPMLNLNDAFQRSVTPKKPEVVKVDSDTDSDETVFDQTETEVEMFSATPPAPAPNRKRGASVCVTSTSSSASITDCRKRIAPPTSASSSASTSIKRQRPQVTKMLTDFDKIPGREAAEPKFAYKPEKAVRKKQERQNLPGWDCPECRDYYEGIQSQLAPGELERLRNACSKHRSKHPELDLQGNTPRYFWDLDFPSTQECIDKGLLRIGERSQTMSQRQRRHN